MANHADEYIKEMQEMRKECYITSLLENVADLLAEGESIIRTELLDMVLADIDGEIKDMEGDPDRLSLCCRLRCVSRTLNNAVYFSEEYDKRKRHYSINKNQMELF